MAVAFTSRLAGLTLVSLFWSTTTIGAPPSNDPVLTPSEVHRETTELLRADAQAKAEAVSSAVIPAAASNDPATRMDIYIVRDSKSASLVIPRFETSFGSFVRTGTIVTLPGKVETTIGAEFSPAAGSFATAKFKLGFSW